MGFRVVEQARSTGRPSGEVRVSTCKNATVTLLSVFCGPEAMARAGFELGDPVQILRGEDEDAGWIRVEKCAPVASARLLGKMPGTKGGNARFRAPKEWGLPMMTSTDIPQHEWRAELGAVTLRLPALMRGVAVEGQQPAMPEKPAALADTAPSTTKDAPARSSYRTAARSDMLRRLWPLTGMSAAEIRAQLSLLDGPEIPATKTVLYHWAESLGMPTNRSTLAGGFATSTDVASGSASEARVSAAAAAVTPQQAVAPPSQVVRSTNGLASRAALPTEHPDKPEAVQMLEAGQTVRFVAEEFGLPVSMVATWSAELRGRQQDGKAA